MQMTAYLPPKTKTYLFTVQRRAVPWTDRPNYEVEAYYYSGTLSQARRRAREEAAWESTLIVAVFDGTDEVFMVHGDFAN